MTTKGEQRRRPKRVTAADLCFYFSEQNTMNSDVISTVTRVMSEPYYSTLNSVEQENAISSAFLIGDIMDIHYNEPQWGSLIHEIHDLGRSRKQHEQWQSEIAKLKRHSKGTFRKPKTRSQSQAFVKIEVVPNPPREFAFPLFLSFFFYFWKRMQMICAWIRQS
eukprot:m.23448 g.23448  ORF g.23448 m.23448 type:complete len:164 (+) comp5544_c1_seq1:149-640(+)